MSATANIRRDGTLGWTLVLGVALAWNKHAIAHDHELLCVAYRRTPRWLTWPLTFYLVAHVTGAWPETLDPLGKVAAQLARGRK